MIEGFKVKSIFNIPEGDYTYTTIRNTLRFLNKYFSLRDLLEDSGFQVDKIDYPFFETEYFTKENLNRIFDTSKVSPVFYGNFMTLYAIKR